MKQITSLKSLFLLSILLMFTACASTPSSPKWLNKPYDKHPKSRYLVSVASADNSNDADSRALAGLSRNFEVAIKDTTMDFSKASVTRKNKQQAITNESNVTRTLNAFSSEVLEGASIDERWKSKQGLHHSLAVLNKAQATRRFRNRLHRMDSDTSRLVAKSSSTANLVVALSALEKARQLQQERLQLDRNLSVVAGSGKPTRYSESYFRDQIYQILAKQRFRIQAEPSQLATQLQSAVSQVGSKVSNNAAYTLHGVLDMNKVMQKQGWFWLRGSLELKLEYKGKIIAKKRITLKESSKQQAMLETRMLDKLTAKMGNYFYSLLTSADVSVK